MKLHYIAAATISLIFNLSIQAQKYNDSTNVSSSQPSQTTSILQNNPTVTDSISSVEEEDTDSIIPPFTTDSCLNWKENITTRLNNILKSPLLETTQVSVMVWDLTDDVPIFQFRERLHLRPASTMKCLTAIATLDTRY